VDVHPVFHISLLKPTRGNSLPGQYLPPPEPIVVDSKSEYEVEEVVDSHVFWQQLQYLIKWYRWDNLTWEHATEVNKLKAIDDFYAQYPNKPSPLTENLN
jgi:hypothetical protein